MKGSALALLRFVKWSWMTLKTIKRDSQGISKANLGNYRMLESKLNVRSPIKRKPPLQPRSSTLNIQGNKLVGSYGDHLSLPVCDHYWRSILTKSNPTNLNRVDKVGTNHCRARSRTFNVRSHLQMDLAAQEHQLVSVTLWKLRKLSDSNICKILFLTIIDF